MTVACWVLLGLLYAAVGAPVGVTVHGGHELDPCEAAAVGAVWPLLLVATVLGGIACLGVGFWRLGRRVWGKRCGLAKARVVGR